MNKPSVLARAKAAYRVFKHGRWLTASGDWSRDRQTKKLPYIWPNFLTGQPQWSIIDFGSYAQEGFNENAVIYSAIMYKVRALITAPLRVYSGTPEEPELLPPEHVLSQLVARPNRWQSWSEFQGLAEVFLNLSGNCYIYLDKEEEPWAMYLLRPDQVRIVPKPGKKELMGFLYIPSGKMQADAVPYLPQDIIHIRLPNPLDPLDGLGYGLAPLSPAARSANVDNEVTRYLQIFFQKGAMPPGLIKYDIPLDDSDVMRARTRWQEIYGGVDNWADIVILDQGGEYERVGLSFNEMGFEGIDERNEARMTQVFGVPPILIGARVGLKHATYSNYELARKAFWEDTMVPELRMFEAEYQHYLGGNGVFVAFDLSRVPALSLSAAEKRETAGEAFQRAGITRNEYRAALHLDPIEGGDVYLIPFNMTEIPAGVKSKAEGHAKGMGAEWKAAFLRQIDARARGWEKQFADAARKALDNDRRKILTIVSEAKAKALEGKQTVAWGEALLAMRDYFRMEAGDNWREVFIPILSGLIVERGEQLNVDFGMEFDVRNLLAEEWFEKYVVNFAKPINKVSEETIRAILQQGMEEGWSIPEMTRNLETTFEQWMDGDLSPEDFEWLEERMPPFRLETIARTETIKASNAGSEALYKDWGMEQKEWLATMDGRTRDAHAAASGQVVGIDESFEVGGQMLAYPGDPAGSAENVINCRCTVLPVVR